MDYRLPPRDYQMLVDQFGGDEAAAREALKARGYTVDGADSDGQNANTPGNAGGLGALDTILGTQRASIGKLYDDIATNIQKRYRAPDLNDLLINIGMGMMAPPGEDGEGGFRGSLMRGLQGVGQYAQSRRAYEQDMNKMLSDVEIGKAKSLADLEEKYLTAAASAQKAANSPQWARTQDPTTGEVTLTPVYPSQTSSQSGTTDIDPKDLRTLFVNPTNLPMDKLVAFFNKRYGAGRAEKLLGGQ